MASSETDDSDALQIEPDSWIALRCRVAEARKELLAAFFFSIGSRGLSEEHAGLDLGEDGPLLSGDPEEWSPSAPDSPDGHVVLCAWFVGTEDPDRLRAETSARMEELGIGGAPTVERVEPEDWNAAWKKHFEPFQISPRLWIVPTWHEVPAITGGAKVLRVDPGMAFGTGTHFTTSGCLRMIDEHLRAGNRVSTLLDVGTGTGILALGALLLGAERAVGLDTSPEAVAAARENAALNGVADRFEILLGPLSAAPGTRYPLVAANLLAPLLIRLARPLADRLIPGGVLIASGLLQRQARSVLDAFEAAGLVETGRLEDADWVVLRVGHR